MKKIAASLAVLALTAACSGQQPAQVIYKKGDDNSVKLAQAEGSVGGLSLFPRWNDGNFHFAKGETTPSNNNHVAFAANTTVQSAPVQAIEVAELAPVSAEPRISAGEVLVTRQTMPRSEYEGQISFASLETLPDAFYDPNISPAAR